LCGKDLSSIQAITKKVTEEAPNILGGKTVASSDLPALGSEPKTLDSKSLDFKSLGTRKLRSRERVSTALERPSFSDVIMRPGLISFWESDPSLFQLDH